MADDAKRRLFSAERRMLERAGGFVPAQAQAPAPVDQVQTQAVLSAIGEVKKLIEALAQQAAQQAAQPAEPQTPEEMPEMSVLRGQLHDLKDSIDKTKGEIAAIHRPGEEDDKFTSAALELSAIVDATEEATNNILGAAEDIQERVAKIKERIEDVGSNELLDEIMNITMGIFENCNFQDITGQRTSKVVKTINYLEERILTMINIWGEEEFIGIELPEDARSADEKLLEGPQLDGQGISQNDIDSLFD